MTLWDWDQSLDCYVNHYSFYQAKNAGGPIPPDRISTIDTDFARFVDFKRIAPHHVVLPPGCRTSFPHAESREEEFVFVLKGHPHLWLNGYLYELSAGHAIGFPAGTGIAHTFMNQTEEEVHLLVVGERTKPDNLCSFPVNPELKESCQIWWATPPMQKLGPHSGIPGVMAPSDLGKSFPPCLVFCPNEPPGKPFHYPGDNETFGEGFRISDRVGLNTLGIWYERLPPGKRSAFPHAHSHEEEFVFIVKGNPTIWLNGFAKRAAPGDFAAFPSNTGIAHVVINDTQEEVIYVCIGESQSFPGEKIFYPLNPLRQRECFRKGSDWRDAPKFPRGNSKPVAAAKAGEHLAFRCVSDSSAEEILKIFQESMGYFQNVEGCSPTISTATLAMVDDPKRTTEKYFKEFLMIDLNDEPIGVLDLHVHHPEEGVCYLGLLLIKEALFGKGLGRKCYRLAEDYLSRAHGIHKIRLGVSNANPVEPFWEKEGFLPNGKTYQWSGESKTSLVREFEKEIRR